MTKQELLDKANDLPLAPGVYLMMDKTGCVIYVGKAKKLKNRVSQYFQENSSHNEKTRRMVSQVDHFDTIFVSTEFEALILENSLIKQHMPRYNILLKDDKGYPFVRLGTEHYPRFTMVGKPADDNALYFGPFGGRNETRAAIDAICAAFRLPTCSRKFPRDIGKERPCLNHHMGRCDAFCRGTPDEDEYMRRIGQAEELLNGHYRRLTRALVTAQGREIDLHAAPNVFALIGQIQEETHRFAITFHHESHSKSSTRSALDGIPGVGKVRVQALLKTFKSVRAIREADIFALERVLPKDAAASVYLHFHGETGEKEEKM